MTVHTHKIRKSARAESEKLPDITGTKITYAGGVECQIEVTQRRNDEPTISAGSTITVGGRTGVCTEASTEILPQYKLDGAIVWEANYTLATDGDSV
ncbi:MAG: hypothetical protein M1325_01185 [Actinobacteria bacterium]|nr:hypothetical protein [Actinomycetota bacterium]